MATLSLFVDECQLATIRGFVARIGQDLGLDESTIHDLQLAVDEACCNLVKHGYDGLGGQVELALEPTDDGVTVTIRDWGRAFEPNDVPVPDVDAPLEQRPAGGLGLFIMRHMMDEVQFEFDADKGNTLTMKKRT